jgi:asparagine synthase (glutamine-hydrolysing)
MCGIVASIGPPADLASPMRDALASLTHRGPDGEGLASHAAGRVWLGHRRLALIDVRGGVQPIANEDGSVVAVVNGELYDDTRIRAGLTARGHRFASASDSEILVHLYEDFGDACVDHLRGEFAFVLVDLARDRILAGRDRFGIKPLYWAMLDGRLNLTSSLKALRVLGLPGRWDGASVTHALAHQYLPPARTLLAGAYAVPPGHLLEARFGSAPRLRRYHTLRDTSDSHAPADAALHVRTLLEEAVRLRLRCERPLGAYLSGGLDSAAVVALAARHRPRLDTFGVAFARAPWDESRLAEETASALGVHHTTVSVAQRDLVDHLPAAVAFAEGPAVNGQLVAKYRLALAARAAGAVAVLTGEGADEAFLGYAHLRVDHLGPATERPSDAHTRGVMLPCGGASAAPRLEAVRRALGFVPTFLAAKVGFGLTLSAPLDRGMAERAGDPVERLLAGLLDPAEDPEPAILAGVAVQRSAALWTRLALGGYILRTLGDGTEMAASLEGRPAFLDHVLFDFAWSLPVATRLEACGREKAVLRDALFGVVPEAVRVRPKQPFLAPPVVDDVYDDARAMLLDALQYTPFLRREAVGAWMDALADADEDTRAAADPVWTTWTSLGLLGQTLGLSEVSDG